MFPGQGLFLNILRTNAEQLKNKYFEGFKTVSATISKIILLYRFYFTLPDDCFPQMLKHVAIK
jgi:hypothetical protein